MKDAGCTEIAALGEWHICIVACYSPKQVGYKRIVERESIDPHYVILAKVTVANNDMEIGSENILYAERTKCESKGNKVEENKTGDAMTGPLSVATTCTWRPDNLLVILIVL